MGGGAREKKKSEIRLGENNKLEPLWIIKYSERMKDKRKNVLIFMTDSHECESQEPEISCSCPLVIISCIPL